MAQKKKRSAARPPDTPEPVLPGVNPAAPEHDEPDESAPFVIVGIGASAGGLDAISHLLRATPLDTGMAFVIVQHLDPSHSSMLTEILGRSTRMPVVQISDQMTVEPNRVYVIPPGKNMVL